MQAEEREKMQVEEREKMSAKLDPAHGLPTWCTKYTA